MVLAVSSLLALEKEAATPFHIVTLLIFLIAIFHTLFANHFTALAERVAERDEKHQRLGFFVELLRFLGEVEIIFALWVVPLFIAICFFFNCDTAIQYLNTRPYLEPILVVVIMTLTSTRPIVMIAEGGIWLIAQMFGGSLRAWWFTILTLGPLLGSFITEVGAMTITAMLLHRKFFLHHPNKKIAYCTLGLLFVNVSVGGLLTNYAAPPVLMVASAWNWDSWFLISNFGWKAVIGIFTANSLYYLFLRKDLLKLEKNLGRKEAVEEHRPVPFWITIVHILAIIWVVTNAHYPAVFIGAFLLFLGFHQATMVHQSPLILRKPLLVGVFLAGLIVHGGLQGWWLDPLFSNLTEGAMMLMVLVLAPFNDNAAIAYLATMVPNLSDPLKYAIMSGIVAGGGLTIIANAPNPAGQMILKRYFKRGISPVYLFSAALLPTVILLLYFYFF